MEDKKIIGYIYKKPCGCILTICVCCLDRESGLDPDYAEPIYDDDKYIDWDWDFSPEKCDICGGIIDDNHPESYCRS